jgi:hypothetical protein
MASTLDTLEQQIRGNRRALARNIDEIRTRAEAAVDWEAHYRRHMGAALTVAALGGLVLGALSKRHASAVAQAGPVGRFATQAADALLAVATTAAVDFIAEVIPGFREEFRTRASS